MYIGRGRGITLGTVLEDVPDFRRTVSEDVADPDMFVASLESVIRLWSWGRQSLIRRTSHQAAANHGYISF